MQNIKQAMIDFLMKNANPSIKLRVQREVLNNLTLEENMYYQTKILDEKNIKYIIDSQKENGWIGNGFHGANKNAGQFDNQEVGLKYLSEKGIDKNNPFLKKAIYASLTVPLENIIYERNRKIYKIDDEFSFAAFGLNIINYACISRAGYEDVIDMSKQIKLCLESFKRVMDIDSILDITRTIKNEKTRIFNENEKWPCRYHLDILAHTNSWKNEVNIKMLAGSIEKMMKTDRKELIGFVPSVWIGHAVGSLGGFPSQGLSVKTSSISPNPITCGKPDFYNLEYIEWFARCGVIPFIPELKEIVDDIRNSIDENGICRAKVLESAVREWGPYAGLQLEVDWRSSIRKDCDITFRALLILHYSNQ